MKIPAPYNDVRKTRIVFGLNQSDFWSRVQVQQAAASRYENQLRPIPRAVKLLLEIAYGTDGDDVIRRLRDHA